mgnify:CR=1 FL=1
MSKITLEITEVVNGLTINETPITLQGDLLAAASTSATAVSFTPAGGIAATNVQAALTELDTEKMPLAGGTFTGDVTFDGASSSMEWDTSANQLKFNDGVKAVFGAAHSLTDADLEIYHISGNSYIRDTGEGTLFIQTDGPGITLGSTANNLALSATFVPGGAINLYHNYSKKFETTSSGIDVTGLVEFDSLSGTGAVAITDILDADDMSGASATTLSTSESIKAYVDNQVASKDNTDEITEGSTNLYFTNARADARIDAADTGDLSEGSNLYFTNARADARIAANLIDEDGFGTNSVTRAPSQQSVKAYVDAQVGAPDIDGGTIDGATVGATTPSTGKFTEVRINSANPALFLDDTDGNELFKLSHQGGQSFVSSLGSGSDFGSMTFFRNNIDAGIAAKATFKFNANGDFITFKDDGTTNLLKIDASNGRVAINTEEAKTDLQIGDSTADVGLLLAGQNSSTTSAQLLFSDNVHGDDPHEWGMGIRYDATTNALNIDDNFNNGSNPYAANNSRVTIMRDNGKVGIGTAAPTGSANSLHVVGGIQGASMTVSSAIPALNLNDSDGNEQFRISTNAGSSRISPRGVGTGYGDLTFYRSKNNGVDADPATTDTAVFKYTNTGNFIVYNDDVSVNAFKVTGASGNVGINTSAPGEKLDVLGTAKATQLNIRTGTSLGTVATLSDDSSLTSWKLTDQSYYTGNATGGPASNAGLQSAPTGFFVVDNDTSANASTINGSKAFLIGSNNDDGVDEYTLGSAYNIGSMTFVNRKTGLTDTAPQDLEVHSNGQYVFVLGKSNKRLRRFILTTPYAINTLSTATGDDPNPIQNFSIPDSNTPTGFTFGGSGTDYGKKLYVVDSIEDTLQEFALANAFDLSTAAASAVRSLGINDATKGVVASCTGVRFSADGTKVYLSDNAGGDDITRLNLSTPWNISTTTYHEAFYVGAVDLSISGIDIAGTEIYTVDTGTDTVRQYTSNNSGVTLNADSLHIPGSIRVTENITSSGEIRVDGKLRATGGATLAGTTISGGFTVSNASGNILLGPENATGQLKVGRSTKTHTVDIHDGVTEDGKTATVNIGTSGASGSTTNINIGGGVGTCTTTIDADLVIPGETPASATAAGTAGQIAWDVNYIYICTATNTWKRVAIGTW